MQVGLKQSKSIDELIACIEQVLRGGDFINWNYWKENLVAFSQDYNEYWGETTYRVYSRDGLALEVKIYNSGGFYWSIYSIHECNCGD